jgi:hypothetical protein
MTDRELLEAAYAAYMPGENYTRLINDAGSDYWNPLTDDGDAFRLMVKLGLTIQRPWMEDEQTEIREVRVWSSEPEYVYESLVEIDQYAATRRAIVRAAAEIGRSMK